jgi:hypothetical protein
LPVAEWQPTRDTLHLWTQIVGKVRLALAAPVNHWWQVTFHLWSHGLTTSLMPIAAGGVEIRFDFVDHALEIETSDQRSARMDLRPRSVADFYGEFTARLKELDIDVPIMGRPVEVERAIPFAEDHAHASYDATYVERFWQSLVDADRVLETFRAGFAGKASPVHFFWGGFDLAVTRFSGRAAPRHPGGVPNCPDWVMHDAYSHEVSSCGYWPVGASEGIFYSYAYPEPDGFRDWPVDVPGAAYDDVLGEFVLPYAEVRAAADPDGLLLRFLERTYEAAADLAHWDRATLERHPSTIAPPEPHP